MSSKTFQVRRFLPPEHPWRRVVWVLPAALFIGTSALWAFGSYLGRLEQSPLKPKPIDARLLELPISQPDESAPMTAPTRPQSPLAAPSLFKPARTAPSPPKAVKPAPLDSVSSAPVEKPAAPIREENDRVPLPAQPMQAPPDTSTENTSPTPLAAGPVEDSRSSEMLPTRPETTPSSTPPPGGITGARAIFQPKPEIPEDLREEALHAVAVARFQIAADGTSTVELITPTPNLKLNRALLDTLKKWRFFPAIKDGHPIASIQDLRISVEVK